MRDESGRVPPRRPVLHHLALPNLHLSSGRIPASGALTATADITNTGATTGHDVDQLYVPESGTSVLPPVRKIEGFQRVTLLSQGHASRQWRMSALAAADVQTGGSARVTGLATAGWNDCRSTGRRTAGHSARPR
jgi:hypothetical protein